MNDITTNDIITSKLDFVPVVNTGINIPGVTLKKSSKEFLTEYNTADLIIAKGQGNFESLYDDINKEAFFLFKVKCPVISKYLNRPLGSIEIMPKNIWPFLLIPNKSAIKTCICKPMGKIPHNTILIYFTAF